MSWKSPFRILVAVLSAGTVEAQTPVSTATSAGSPPRQVIVVPERVAALVRPILDLQQANLEECGEPGQTSRCTEGEAYDRSIKRSEQFGELLHKVVQKKGSGADEALVVLMCFYMGESQDEVEEVVKRGRRTLPYLKKYRARTPKIPKRAYLDSLFQPSSIKEDTFSGAIEAILRGWRSPTDNPEG